MPQEWQVQGVSGHGQRPLVYIVAGDLQANLALVVEPPGDDAVDLAEQVDQRQLRQQDDTLLVVAASNGAVLNLQPDL